MHDFAFIFNVNALILPCTGTRILKSQHDETSLMTRPDSIRINLTAAVMVKLMLYLV